MALLSALQYGLVGLSGIMLVLAWRILAAEQRRPGTPRAGLLRHFRLFMIFCGVLTLVNVVLQSIEKWQTGRHSQDCQAQVEQHLVALKEVRSQLSARDNDVKNLSGLLHSVDQLLKQKLNVEVARPFDAGSADRLRITIGYIREDIEKALLIAARPAEQSGK